MPIYEYQCTECGERLELRRSKRTHYEDRSERTV
jgi:putative FmdB family regulatory protein